MKILLIDVNCKSSSTGKIVYDLYSYINQTEDEAALCYGRGKRICEKNIYKFGLDIETYLHAALSRLTGYNGCFSYFSTKRLIRFIRKYKPDVVHIHELHAYFVNIRQLLNFLKKENIKIVHTLHCEYSYTGKCGLAYDCEKWKSQCENCPGKKAYVASLFFDRSKEMFLKKKEAFAGIGDLTITTPSEWLTERAKQSFLRNYPIFTVHNGVDTNTFCYHPSNDVKKKYGIPDHKKIVLSVAPNIMSSLKGGNYILEIAKNIKAKDVVFLMVGVDGNLMNTDNVIQLPRIYNQKELADIYSCADVFVLTSKRETFSLTCAEALACGTPVVGFRCGAPESIFGEPYAKFTDYGDVKRLEQFILEFLNSEPRRDDVSAYAKADFSKDTMIEKYIKIYKNQMISE